MLAYKAISILNSHALILEIWRCQNLLDLSAEKTVAIFHEVSRNSHSIASIFVKKIGIFSQLKIIALDHDFLKDIPVDIKEYIEHFQEDKLIKRQIRSCLFSRLP